MSKRKKANTRQVKQQLFLQCGKVDMYSIEEHNKRMDIIKENKKNTRKKED